VLKVQSMASKRNDMTPDEIALYDRQLRVWGIEAQKKMRGSKVLVVNIGALGAEICKNIVLAGIGTLTLLDDSVVSESNRVAQYFVTEKDIGKNRATASAASINALNPRVSIKVDTSKVQSKSEKYFEDFDIVCLTECSSDVLISVGEACRKAPKSISLLFGQIAGLNGMAFADLNEYTFVRSSIAEGASIEGEEKQADTSSQSSAPQSIKFASARQVFSLSWSQLLKQFGRKEQPKLKLFCAFQVLLQFESVHDRLPTPEDKHDLAECIAIRDKLGKDILPTEVLSSVVRAATSHFAPTAAIIGGIIGQEILRILSGKDMTLNNVLIFDSEHSEALIKRLSVDDAK